MNYAEARVLVGKKPITDYISREVRMKRWIWLLALPYVVNVSTHGENCKQRSRGCDEKAALCQGIEEYDCKEVKLYSIPLGGDSMWGCAEESKDFCYDLAEALNTAHEWRNRPMEDGVLIYPGTDDIEPEEPNVHLGICTRDNPACKSNLDQLRRDSPTTP